MKVEPEQRAALLGEYIAEHSATVRAAARAFGCSKSTVHKDVSAPPCSGGYRPCWPGTRRNGTCGAGRPPAGNTAKNKSSGAFLYK